MNLDLPHRAVVAVVAFLAIALTLLGLMLARLGALPLPGSSSRSVSALFANAEGLPVQADVLVHGVKVGSVSALAARPAGTLVTLALNSSAPALHLDASVRVGFKTALGEPFVELDPGRVAGAIPALLSVRPSVAIDEALAWLDPAGRANARAALRALGRGAAGPGTSNSEVSGTLAELETTTIVLARLASELRAQRADLSGTISAGGAVLSTLASRVTQLRGLTVDGRRLLEALAGQRNALAGVLVRLPGLLSATDSTLRAAQPLIAKATPVVGQLAAAAPALTPALRSLPAITDAAGAILGRAQAIRTTVLPALAALRALARPSADALSVLGPTLADLVPVVRYLGPRGRTIASWFANTADLGSHGDATGDWARFFVMFDPSTLLGLPTGAPPGNSYTAPGDAAHNQAYQPGGYPRLMPFSPALGHG